MAIDDAVGMEGAVHPNTTNEILDLLDAPFHSAALGAALELGLFWSLEEAPQDAVGVAQELGIPLKRCQYWLQLLQQIGLLEQHEGVYQPSPTARSAILESYARDTWQLLAGEARDRLPGLRDLPDMIRESGSAWRALGLEPRRYLADMKRDPELARRFTRMLYEIHRPLAEALVEFLDLEGVERLLDLGGGSGVVSLALLQRHPELRATVADIGNVCLAGREIADQTSLAERIAYHAADFLEDELPTGFDLVLECDVNVFGERLFRKVKESLRLGGRFVIVDELAPSEEIAPPSRVHWAFEGSMIDPEYSFATSHELRELLQEVGFQILSERFLPPLPGVAERFDRHLTVIEAGPA